MQSHNYLVAGYGTARLVVPDHSSLLINLGSKLLLSPALLLTSLLDGPGDIDGDLCSMIKNRNSYSHFVESLMK